MKNFIQISFIVIFTSIGLRGFAQLDTSYISTFKNNISLGAKLGILNNNFIVKNKDVSYSLNSNIDPIISVWFKYKKMPSISIGIPLPISNIKSDSLAKTKGIAIDINGQIAKGFILDGYFFYKKGFNLQNRSDSKFVNAMHNTYNINANLELVYIFNFKKFSYKSAYLFGEIQRKSSGSFLAGISSGYTKMHNKEPFFKDELIKHSNINFSDISAFTASVSGGYMHTFVLGKEKNWFINGALTMGPNLNIGKTKYFNNRETEKILNIGLDTKYKAALGYNLGKWSISLVSTGNFVSFRPYKNTILNSNVIDVRFLTIYKF